LNNGETDVDCGGPDALTPRCNPPLRCVSSSDCSDFNCYLTYCQAPNDHDGIMNGHETDVDCGGVAQQCADGLQCIVAGDCASGNCAAGVCAP